MITGQQLKQIVPFANTHAVDTYPALLNEILPKYHIDTPARIAAFIAQVAHESGSFKYLREIASGQAYEGRKDLGNILNGDGKKFKGRGLIQITGRINYEKCSKALFKDNSLIHNPEILATPKYAVESACWFWQEKNLNSICDMPEDWIKEVKRDDGSVRKYTKIQWITKLVNGGQNGIAEREAFYKRAKEVIK